MTNLAMAWVMRQPKDLPPEADALGAARPMMLPMPGHAHRDLLALDGTALVDGDLAARRSPRRRRRWRPEETWTFPPTATTSRSTEAPGSSSTEPSTAVT